MYKRFSTVIFVLTFLCSVVGQSYAHAPTAVIADCPKHVLVDDTVQFDGSGSYDNGYITKYDWDFPPEASNINGQYLVDSNCVFDSAGNYAVKLKVKDNEGLWSAYDTCAVFVATDENRVYNINKEKWYPHIQLAIDDADTNNVLEVQQGTCYETIDFGGKSLILRSTDPNDWEVVEATIIDAGGLGYTVRFDSGEGSNSVLKGFTITGATGSLNRGIYCSETTPTISNCRIVENKYGIICLGDDQPSPSINNCIIQSNDVVGLILYSFNGGTVSNCVVQYNGACGVAFDHHNGTITNCTISNNNTDTSDGVGINCYNSTTTIKNCNIYDNDNYGVYCEYYSSPIITNCTIVNNEPNGLYVDNSSSVTVYNSILWGNSPDQIDGSGTATVTYSCVQGGHAGTGNISSDPCFVDAENDNLRLSAESNYSPCIDAGDNDAAEGIDTDLDGKQRIVGSDSPPKVDMGAYEAVPTVGFWKLDGNADDSSLNENDGTVNGNPVWETEGGVMSGALQFDGNGDYIDISNPADYSTNSNFTWSAWMRTLETDENDKKVISDGGVIMAKCPSTGTTGVKCLHVIYGGGDDGKLRFNLGTTAILSSDRKVDDGLWHLVAVTVEFADPGDDTIKLYVDGKVKTTTFNVNADETDFLLRIGYANIQYYGATTANFFDGRIDDVRVYDYVLTESQINDLYEESGYWRFVVACDSRDDIYTPDSDDPDEYDGVNNYRLQEIANAIKAEKAEFVLFPGDLVNSGTTTQLNRWRYGDSHGNNLMKDVYDAGITVMPIRGNHDVGGNWENVFYEIPDNGPSGDEGFTYYIEHRNALFVGIDVYKGTNHQVDEPTRNWLNGVLSSSQKKHVFVATHDPAFKVQHTDCLGLEAFWEDYRDPFWHILEDESRCRLYFCGHDHFYDHAWIDDGVSGTEDVHQMVVGTAGAPLRDYDGTYNGFNGSWEPTRIEHEDKDIGDYCYGYVVVEVWGKANVTTHWKHRVNVDTHYPSTYEPGGTGNNGDVFEYAVP